MSHRRQIKTTIDKTKRLPVPRDRGGHIRIKRKDCAFSSAIKTKRRGLVLGKRAKEYAGISSEFNDEINRGFLVLSYISYCSGIEYNITDI